MRKTILFLLIFLLPTLGWNQKIGLVLSGGGADALAHIGVIKALEENNVPIDYITGTSMGALIGALYASGIPIEEIEKYFTSDYFREIGGGAIPSQFNYYFPVPDPEPVIVPLKFKKGSNGYSLLLPSRIIASEAFDMDILKSLVEAEKLANYNFDSLKIPFRCVAADIVTKEQVVFSEGSLTEAVRASMSFPLFIRPIKINGHLMYDGGIYNNFPVDIMCSDFQVDFIIGSNVSENLPPPNSDDLIGQLQTILVKHTDYDIYCLDGELIEPSINLGTFNFKNNQIAIDSGYAATQRKMEHIKYHVTRKPQRNDAVPPTQSNGSSKIIIGETFFTGINEKQMKFAKSVLQRRRKKFSDLDLKTFERNYYRLYQGAYIEDIFTTLKYNPVTKKYDAHVAVSPIKSLTFDVGGYIASRPVSEGYAGISYNNLSTYGVRFGLSTYFGKMYQALKFTTRFDFPTHVPFYIQPKVVLHNWNWFESRQSNLFVDDKPNYIVEGELFSGLEVGLGISNSLKITAEANYLQMESEYYQTREFTPSDTLDRTKFTGLILKSTLSSNSLNLKQFAYSGSQLSFEASYVIGNEFFTPGSTSPSDEKSTTKHNFLQFRLDYQDYLRINEKFRFGYTLSGVFSTMGFFNNYTSTVIQSPSFKPTPDSRTLFLESFHANKFAAGGIQLVFLPVKNLQLRAEGYIFQPYQPYVKDDQGKVGFGNELSSRFTIVSGVISYQTPVGPLGFSVNYYYNNPDISPENEAPITALFNFGYILFNKRAYH